MKEIVEQWVAFMSGKKMKKYFNSMAHFGYMFNEGLSDEELKTVFQFFPKKEELLQRIKNVLGEGFLGIYLAPNKQGKEQELLHLAKVHLLEMQRIARLGEDEEYWNIIDNSSFRFVSQEEVDGVRENYDGLDSYFRDKINSILSDFIPENITGVGDKIYDLKSAFYGLTTDYNIEWYLLAPLLTLDIDYEAYVKFWQLGGEFAVTENEVLVSCYQPPQQA